MHPPAADLDDRLYRSDEPSSRNREISPQISTLFRNDRWFANRFEVWSAPKFSVSLFRYVIQLCRAGNVRYFNSSVVSTRRQTVSKVTRWLSFRERFLREFLQLAIGWKMVTRIFVNKYD